MIIKEWRLSENSRLVADGSSVRVVTRLPAADGPPQELSTTITDVASAVLALQHAVSWNQAVYPPAGPGRADLEFPQPMRARAWDALAVTMARLPDDETVTGFLRDYHARLDKMQDQDSPAVPVSIEQYAVTWFRLRYGS